MIQLYLQRRMFLRYQSENGKYHQWTSHLCMLIGNSRGDTNIHVW